MLRNIYCVKINCTGFRSRKLSYVF